MATPEPTFEDLRRSVRRLKILALFLLGGIMILGWLSASLLRTLDDDYAELVDRTVPAFNSLRQLSNNALSTQRAILGGLVASDSPGLDRTLGLAGRRLEAGRRQLRSINSLDLFRESPAFRLRLTQAGDHFHGAAAAMIELMKAEHFDQARVFRQNEVKPALDAYLEQIESAARFAENVSLNTRDTVSDRNHSRATLMMGITSLPLLGFVILATTIGAIMVGVLVVLRRVDLEPGR